jgi:nucleotide-binding universal stress UspA family protein
MFLLLYIQVQVALIALRKKRPELRRGFKVPFVPFIPIVGILLQLTLAVFLFFYSPLAWLSAGIWITIGLVVFYGYARKRDRAYTQLVAVQAAAQRREYRILACVGSLARAEIILNAAAAVARHYEGELIVLNVVEISDRDLLAQGMESARTNELALARLVREFQMEGIPVKVVVKISHRISFGVTETALEEQSNLIVMGRARQAGLIERLAATVVDRVVRSTPAQVMVVTAEHWPKQIDNVLFAYERGPNSKLSADLIAAFGKDQQTKVRAVHVLPWTTTAEESQHAVEEMTHDLGAQNLLGERKVVRSGDIVTGLLREAKQANLIVMGGTEAGVIEQLLGYSPPLELAERTALPVITCYEMSAEPKRWIT